MGSGGVGGGSGHRSHLSSQELSYRPHTLGLGGSIPSSDPQVRGCNLSFSTHPLFCLTDFWREAPWSHGLDHAYFRCPVHIWRSQWVSFYLLPVSAIQALSEPRPLCCAYCSVYVCGACLRQRVLCGHLGGDLAGGDCSHEGMRVSVWM